MSPTRMTPRTWMALVLLVVSAAACGPRTKAQRQADGERRTDEALVLLNEAERELRNLNADEAEPRLAKAKELLSHPDVELSPEGEMLRSQLSELRGRVARVRDERARQEREAREERARRELEAAEEKQRDKVVQAMSEVSAALEALEEKDAGAEQVEAVSATAKRVREVLVAGKALEEKSEDYAASARSTERRLEQAEVRAAQVRKRVDFLSGPVSDRREAEALVKKAKRERDLDARLALYTDARERFVRCGEDAKKLLSEAPELVKTSVVVDGRKLPLRTVAPRCRAKAGSLLRVVKKLEKSRAARDRARARKRKGKSPSPK